MSTVVVVGAKGRQGMAQVRRLRADGHTPRAVSRTPGRLDDPELADVEVVAADVDDEASLTAAVADADAVLFNHPMQQRHRRVELVERMGRVAHAAGVRRMVWNTAEWIPDRPGDPYTYGTLTDGINALWRTGVPATIFGPVLFMDNLLTNWARPFIVGEGRFVYPHNPGLTASWISLDDVAKFMVAALDRPDLEGAWMNLGGPEKLHGSDVARALSAALGREIVYDPCTPEEFGRYLVSAFGDDIPPEARRPFAKTIEDFYVYNNTSPTQPFDVDMGPVLRRIPMELETLAEWAARQDWTEDESRTRPSGG